MMWFLKIKIVIRYVFDADIPNITLEIPSILQYKSHEQITWSCLAFKMSFLIPTKWSISDLKIVILPKAFLVWLFSFTKTFVTIHCPCALCPYVIFITSTYSTRTFISRRTCCNTLMWICLLWEIYLSKFDELD